MGGLTGYTNQLGHATTNVYDALGRKTAEMRAGLETNRFSYSPAGELIELRDGKDQQTTWLYDEYCRQIEKRDHTNGLMFSYTHDANGRLTNRWTPEKGATTYAYDPVGNLLAITYPLSPAISLSYDRLNRLTNLVDAVGTTRYRYTNHVLLSEDGPWASDTVTYSYQQSRQRSGLSLAQPNASPWAQTYAHDAIRRLTNVTSPAGVFAYAYNVGQASSLPLRLALPGGSYITNTYDANARLLSTHLKNSQHSTLNSHSYQLNVGNQRMAVTNFHGNTWDYFYDGLGQLVAASGKEPGGTTNRLHEQYGYKYDPAGNLTARTNNELVQSFLVNSLNQLTTNTRTGTLTVAGVTTSAATNVTVNGVPAALYADAAFARANVSLVNGTNTFTAVAQDALGRKDTNTVSVNLPATVNYAYDANGNLTNATGLGSAAHLALEYDDENQLTRMTAAGSWRSEFTYDGKMRLRVAREYVWTNSAWQTVRERRYVYDGMLLVQERDGNNTPTLTYTRGRDLSGTFEGAGGIGGILALTESGLLNPVSSYYHADGNGNVTCLVNTNQLIVARYAYDPYGNTLSITGPKAEVNRLRFSSKEHHERTGLYYYGYRFYDPNTQRWVNRDPIGEQGGYNLYNFVGNDPPNRIDPAGEAAAIAVGAGIGTAVCPGVGTGVGAVIGAIVTGVGIAILACTPHAVTRDCNKEKREECNRNCHDQYELDSETCRRLHTPRARFLCWQQIGEDQALCIRDCARQFPEIRR